MSESETMDFSLNRNRRRHRNDLQSQLRILTSAGRVKRCAHASVRIIVSKQMPRDTFRMRILERPPNMDTSRVNMNNFRAEKKC